jgi:hypothetical protein
MSLYSARDSFGSGRERMTAEVVSATTTLSLAVPDHLVGNIIGVKVHVRLCLYMYMCICDACNFRDMWIYMIQKKNETN